MPSVPKIMASTIKMSSISFGKLTHFSHIAILPYSWPNLRSLFWNSLDLLNKRFRWFYLLLGFITLAFAGTSWKLESNRSYWVWHRCVASSSILTSKIT